MWKLKRGKSYLPAISLSRLKQIYIHEKNKKSKQRLLAAIQRKCGSSLDKIKKALKLPRTTIYGWIRRIQERGIKGKDSIKQTGRPPKLTAKKQSTIISLIKTKSKKHAKPATIKEAREIIRKRYRIIFSKQHVWRIMARFGIAKNSKPRKRKAIQSAGLHLGTFRRKNYASKKPTANEKTGN